ncbi:CPBP family intramembrane metalloprotease [Chryseobacterium chendengshani]|uniref:CPBP family intramembrane glutamic endopeptidase n=1 Tax=Chryseobacterium sp. LJ668 TaxID=2864040 RepID=UPI001C68E415|nr:CPBP family intramembrane glutamic endopeptidase [Chryseobacterium sp. LJ668]MBW8522477.1 CPBP family intramembrane metalloprotease [Chryseobacterium sp. LJ668]QYK16018.1 CPBP family intramembrane metalloprotease [Chryseobacterium sp. LJ668]
MSLNGKYSVGIIFTFVLLASAMLYSIPVINLFFNFKTFTAELFFYDRLVLWLVLLLILIYNFFLENRSFFAWEDKKYPTKFYLASIIGLYLICSFGGAFLNAAIMIVTQEKISDKMLQLNSIFKSNYFLIIFTCLTAGIIEELLMRAYIQPRIEKIYNSPAAGIVGSALLFGILHSTYGTIGQVVVPFFIGIVFAIFYKKYSNIKILIICHFLIDFISLILLNLVDIKQLSAF